jgi:hypothetical protein
MGLKDPRGMNLDEMIELLEEDIKLGRGPVEVSSLLNITVGKGG